MPVTGSLKIEEDVIPTEAEGSVNFHLIKLQISRRSLS